MHCRAYVVIDFTPSLATNRFLKQIERRNGCSYQHGVTSNHGMIDPISLDDACTRLIAAIAAHRLVILCGAGLSMADPSGVPSAAVIAARVRDQHIATYGNAGEELPHLLEDQADYFFERGNLQNYFIPALIDRNIFAGPPNSGHQAIADFVLTQAAEAVISTNVDKLIESAGGWLFGEVEVALDGDQAIAQSHTVSPLLKIHGCWSRDRNNTVWSKKQLNVEPTKRNVERSAHWLQALLQNKELLVVGFWTDWSYLNEVLGNALGGAFQSRVIIFDPAQTEALQEKGAADMRAQRK